MTQRIIGIRFQKVGKIYHFDASDHPDIKVGDFVIVETSRGTQLGEVANVLSEPPNTREGGWKPIVRQATPRDLVLRQVWQGKEAEAIVNCRAKLKEQNLAGVKIVAAEYTFDGKRLTFVYSSEGQDNVNINGLKKAMNRTYSRVRVDFRQVGPRDAAKIIGGMGACGIENRCCSRFLTEFSPISIKMAKTQGISLAPSEITGMCGRLRCCLIYEYEQYVAAMKEMPKRGKRVITPEGEGKVVDLNLLKKTVTVYIEDSGRKEFPREEVEPWAEVQALKKKAQSPCKVHGDGPCDCQKENGNSQKK
jgi:cell fate regulator YaaT (PSP1 superfamily)